MTAPLRPIIPGDWMGLEQVIKDLWGIINADTSLSDMVADDAAVSDAVVANTSDIVILKSDMTSEKSDTVIFKSDIASEKSDTVIFKSDIVILKSDIIAVATGAGSASDVATNTSDIVILKSDLALLDDCPTYKFISATGQASATNLHLSDGTNWNVNKALIKYIRIVTSSTDWDLYILQNDNGYAANDAAIPMMKIADSISGNANIWLDLPYQDEDASGEVHLYFLDNGGANTASIYIKAFALS